jgi:hypothetical protein
MEDELIIKWGDVGLLVHLTDEQKIVLAPLYELMAQHIIGLNIINKDFGERSVETCIFPIMYRIIKNDGTISDVMILHQNVVDFFNNHEETMLDLQTTYMGIDIEAELCALFVENYLNNTINLVNNLNIKKFIKRHRL